MKSSTPVRSEIFIEDKYKVPSSFIFAVKTLSFKNPSPKPSDSKYNSKLSSGT